MFFETEHDISDAYADVTLNGEDEMTVCLTHTRHGWMHATLCRTGRSQAVRIIILHPEGSKSYVGTVEASTDWYHLRDKVLNYRLVVD